MYILKYWKIILGVMLNKKELDVGILIFFMKFFLKNRDY